MGSDSKVMTPDVQRLLERYEVGDQVVAACEIHFGDTETVVPEGCRGTVRPYPRHPGSAHPAGVALIEWDVTVDKATRFVREVVLSSVERFVETPVFKLDVPVLRAGGAAMLAHKTLLVAALVDLSFDEKEARWIITNAISAVRHVVDEEFRSDETRGGS